MKTSIQGMNTKGISGKSVNGRAAHTGQKQSNQAGEQSFDNGISAESRYQRQGKERNGKILKHTELQRYGAQYRCQKTQHKDTD